MMKTKQTPKHTIARSVPIVAAAFLMAACAVPRRAMAIQHREDDHPVGRRQRVSGIQR